MTANQTAVALHKILLVDDDKAMTYLNKLMLKESDINCQMDECLNGSEALNYIKNTQTLPDIILMDINMPVMDGLHFLEAFNHYKNPVPQPYVFMLSSSDRDMEKCKKMDYPFVKGYFQKPLTEEHIQQILAIY